MLKRKLVHGCMDIGGITMLIIIVSLGKTAPTMLKLFGEQQLMLDATS